MMTLPMSRGQNDTHIHSVEDNHGHGKDRADYPNDHNHLVINFLNMILLILRSFPLTPFVRDLLAWLFKGYMIA